MRLYPLNNKYQVTLENGMNCYKLKPYTKIEQLYLNYLFFPVISKVLGYFAAKRQVTNISLKNIGYLEFDGIDHKDFPKYVDVYVSSATWLDSLTELTEAQLNQLNEKYSNFVHEEFEKYLY